MSQRKVFNGGSGMPLAYYNGDYYDTRLTNTPTGEVMDMATDNVIRPALPQSGVFTMMEGGSATRHRQRAARNARKNRSARKNMRTRRAAQRQRQRKEGGFYPSVMGPFAYNAARLAVPLAAVAASQYLSAPPYFGSKKTARRSHKSRRTTRKH